MENLFKDLEHRGITKQITDPALEKVLGGAKITLYAGFDPTSDSLHVGSLLPLLTLRRFQLAGHKPIAVVGGATGMIGDPSGKSAERNLLDEEKLAHNLKGISGVIAKFLDLSGPSGAKIVNNADWFKGMDYIRFLRDVGKHFTVNHMMAKESVRARLEDREHGISYTEFSYMLLQAYDFYVLNRDHNCTLQIGGSDQWGNITAGIELIRRIHAAPEPFDKLDEAFGTAPRVYGLTHPLVSKSDGTKFGKSEKGNIWLDPERTTPFEFYQFFMNTADADVLTYLKFFTFRSHQELAALENELRTKPQDRAAQKALADEMTKLVHGDEGLKQAKSKTEVQFGGTAKLMESESAIRAAFTKEDTTQVQKAQLGKLTLVELLVLTKLSGSKGAARNDITGGGIYLNDVRVGPDGTTAIIQGSQLLHGRFLILRKGKKTNHLVEFN